MGIAKLLVEMRKGTPSMSFISSFSPNSEPLPSIFSLSIPCSHLFALIICPHFGFPTPSSHPIIGFVPHLGFLWGSIIYPPLLPWLFPQKSRTHPQ